MSLLDKDGKVIIADWLKARDLVKDKGGLPSNVLHDDVFIYSDAWKSLCEQNYYPSWAREVLIYLEQDVKFKKGEDVVDMDNDGVGRKWIFPASQIPEETIGKENVALFVDPQEVEVDNKRVVILANPKSITIIYTFPQTSGWGVADPKTRIPLDKLTEGTPEHELRYLKRIFGPCVQPPLREYSSSFQCMRTVFAVRCDYKYHGVGYVDNIE